MAMHLLHVAQARDDILATQSADNYDEDFEVEEEEVASAVRYAISHQLTLALQIKDANGAASCAARIRKTLTSAISALAANPIMKTPTSKPQACLMGMHARTKYTISIA